MDNLQIPEEGLNLDEWEHIQSISFDNTQSPARTSSSEWDMAAIRDNYLQDSLSFFPPSQHEGLIPATTQTNSPPRPPTASPSSSSASSSNGFPSDNSSSPAAAVRQRFENLGSGISRIIAAKVRHYVVYIGGFSSFASVTGVLAAVLLSLVYAKMRRWRRRVQEENNRLIFLIKERDQKIRELLLQMAQMNELLSARRKVPVLRIG